MTRNVTRTTLCSTLAIATAMVMTPQRAMAQAFQGSGTFANGSGSISTTATTTDITISSAQAVIDWAPSDTAVGNFGAIGFQYSGTTATFSGASDYAVLNRINAADTSRSIVLDGIINSLVNGQTGGTIFFYSPSGLVIGQNAVIDVGSLGLTSSPIAVDGNGSFLSGTTVTFGNSLPGKQVVTVAGSQINALNQGSYVAIVAPRVEHHGAITVNGAAALVGAEAATINFRVGGLFDIQVDSGTTDATGVFSDGSITGNASSGTSDLRRIYMVAVPKNSLLTMAIQQGSNLGFDIAQSADVYGNAVVLSAGHDVSFGSVSSAPSAASGADAGININNANFTSAVYGRANGTIYAGGNNNGSASFASDLSLSARDVVRLSAGFGGTTTVGGNVTLSADASSNVEGAAATAGGVELFALDGSTLSIAGSANLSANGYGGNSFTAGVTSGNGTGGSVNVSAWNGSALSIGGALYANANGFSGYTNTLGANGGIGTGGAVTVQATLGNASVSVGGAAYLSADGTSRGGNDCSNCGGIGGSGQGGSVYVGGSGAGDSVTFTNALSMTANGTGGHGETGAGGAGTGGNITLGASAGTSVTVSGATSLQAAGSGGAAVGSAGDGGAGLGGNIQAFADGGTLGITGNLFESVDGYGGSSAQGTGGAGTGGLGQAFALNSGDLSVGGYAAISGFGQGGDGLSGGIGTGGRAYFSSNSGGNLAITSFAELAANGRGGSGSSGDGGLGQGGHAETYATNNAVLNFNTLYLSAKGDGGGAFAATMKSGNGVGGDIFLQAVSGGTVTIANALAANATGRGGNIEAIGVGGGDGTGGTISLYSRDGNAALNVGGAADLTANGEAGSSGECFLCSGVGGVGRGGTVTVNVLTGPVGTSNSIDFGNQLTMAANGYGGTSTDVAGDNGGAAFGGRSEIFASAGSAHFTGDTSLSANAFGGGSTNGDGGTATGGIARVTTQGGALTFDAALSTHANATGGFGVNGGDAFGRSDLASIISGLIARNGGSISVGGATSLTSTTTGGDAHFSGHGGNAIGATLIFDSNNDPIDGGTTGIVVKGNATAASSVTLAGLTVDTSATGGAGANGAIGLSGGNGGSANAGRIDITTRNTGAVGTTNLIHFGDAMLNADATGGNGGLAGDDSSGGGNGGNATGGFVSIFGSAGNGRVESGAINVAAVAHGGNGGYGGTNSLGFGVTGNGGNGGNALSGGSGFGVVSYGVTVTDYGSASFGAITADVRAIGGDGAAAGTGAPTIGLGGNGGSATGDLNVLYSRGGAVFFTTVAYDGRVQGGTGGNGTGGGIGGNANTGGFGLTSTNRYLIPQPGSLTIDSVTADFDATAGNGPNSAGNAYNLGAIGIQVLRGSSMQIGSFDAHSNAADGPGVGAQVGGIQLDGGSALNVTNAFNIDTTGEISVSLDNSTMTANSVSLHAGDFVANAAPPASFGTVTAKHFDITSDNNVIIDANLDSTGFGLGDSIIINVPGLIQTANLSSIRNVLLTAGNSISTLGINAGRDIDLDAQGSIQTGDLTAGLDINLITNTGAILFGDAFASNDFDFQGGGTVTGGNITAGRRIGGDASGAVNFGNLTAGFANVTGPTDKGFSIGFSSATSIKVGNATGFEAVGFATLGPLTTGNLIAGTDVLTLVSGDMNLGAITAGSSGRIYLADSSMFILAGGPDDFIPALVFGATPVATHGSITINGPVSGGTFQAAAGTGFSSGTIDTGGGIAVSTLAGDISASGGWTAGSAIDAQAGGAIDLGNLSSGADTNLTAGGTLTAGTINSGFDIRLDGGLDVLVSDLTAGDSVYARSLGGSVTTGNIVAVAGENPYNVQLEAATSLTAGTINASGHIVLIAGTDITTSALNATFELLGLAGGSMSFGAIHASDVLLGDVSLAAAGGDPFGFYNVSAVIAQAPVRSGGAITTVSITASGAVTVAAVGDVTLASATAGGPVSIGSGNLTAGAISAGGALGVVATGLATVNGTWSGSSVDLTANDLAISASGAIHGGPVTISSNNANGMFLGDGLSGAGFNLSQAEADRISGSQIAFTSLGGTSPAMTIGNLVLSAAGMTGAEPYRFSAGNSIQILGDLVIGGLIDPASSVGFYTALFMLDESTGSLALTNGSQLGGTLNIHAHDVWVADSTILARLLADPNYSGRDAALAIAPTGISGPVISANVINVTFENGGPRTVTPYTLLVQNTGDATIQQGFLATDANAILGEGASGLIDMVINGQGQTEAGLINGVAVRDALMQGDNPARFTATSTINGCSVSGSACSIAPPPPPPPPVPPPFPDPGVVLADEIVLFASGADDKPLFGNEEQIVENLAEIFDGSGDAFADPSDPFGAAEEQRRKDEEADAASSPIEPPNPLFDSRPLNAKDSTDEPISGGGNPALIGSDIDPTTGGQ